MGDTLMGCHGKKILASENGHNNATPRPPSVKASKTGWERDEISTATKIHVFSVFRKPEKNTEKKEMHNANKMECMKPLWPHWEAYGIPNLKAITSASGRTETRTQRSSNLAFKYFRPEAIRIAQGIAMWVIKDGISENQALPLEYV